MTIRVGVNGFGRIGRNFYRAVRAQGADIEIVSANDLGSVKQMAQLLKFDSVMGRLDAEVVATDAGIEVDGKLVKITSEREPEEPAVGRARRRRGARVDRLLQRPRQGRRSLRRGCAPRDHLRSRHGRRRHLRGRGQRRHLRPAPST